MLQAEFTPVISEWFQTLTILELLQIAPILERLQIAPFLEWLRVSPFLEWFQNAPILEWLRSGPSGSRSGTSWNESRSHLYRMTPDLVHLRVTPDRTHLKSGSRQYPFLKEMSFWWISSTAKILYPETPLLWEPGAISLGVNQPGNRGCNTWNSIWTLSYTAWR
jgi:hypothetical protein